MLLLALEPSMMAACVALLLLLLPQNTNSRCPAAPYSTVCYTAKGLAWYSEWVSGGLRLQMLYEGVSRSCC